jgi:hypothetical protein
MAQSRPRQAPALEHPASLNGQAWTLTVVERLVALDAVRELTGRAAFRLYGL